MSLFRWEWSAECAAGWGVADRRRHCVALRNVSSVVLPGNSWYASGHLLPEYCPHPLRLIREASYLCDDPASARLSKNELYRGY